MQSLGVFFDTIIICSATAFVILLTDVYTTVGDNVDGVALTQESLSLLVGNWAVPFIAIAIFFFSFTSLVGNYYYGETNLAFIKEGTIWLQVYRVAVMGMIIFGSLAGYARLGSSRRVYGVYDCRQFNCDSNDWSNFVCCYK